MGLKSRLYRVKVTHKREKPRPNFFSYNIFMFVIDLDEVERLAAKFPIIGFNRFNLFSFYNSDHFKKSGNPRLSSVRQKMIDYLKSQEIHFIPTRIELLTNLRIMGYVFNPVSFYFLYDENEQVKYSIAEVSNTFGEMKYYLLKTKKNGYFHEIHDKYFYISPFTQLDDKLELKVANPGKQFTIQVDDIKGDEKPLRAVMFGEEKPLTNTLLIKYFFRFPFITLQVIFLIHWQALKLWLKGVKFYSKNENQELQKDIYCTK